MLITVQQFKHCLKKLFKKCYCYVQKYTCEAYCRQSFNITSKSIYWLRFLCSFAVPIIGVSTSLISIANFSLENLIKLYSFFCSHLVNFTLNSLLYMFQVWRLMSNVLQTYFTAQVHSFLMAWTLSEPLSQCEKVTNSKNITAIRKNSKYLFLRVIHVTICRVQ